MNLTQQFIDELNPLLAKAEKAILAGDKHEAERLSYQVLALVARYDGRLSRKAIQDACNNPTANAIAERLGRNFFGRLQ